jgi:drug/metabolite transporter (DMT)-like permease
VNGYGIAATLASALCWSGLDAVRKVLARRLEVTAVVVWLFVGQAPFFGAWALMDAEPIARHAYWLPGLGSTALQVVANVLFVRAVMISPFSVCVPFLSLTPVFTTLVAMPLLDEHASGVQWAGIAAVVTGALLLNARAGSSLLRALWSERGSVLMIAVAAIWSFTAALDKMALEHASVAGHGFVQTAGGGALVLGWLATTGRLGTARSLWPPDRPQLAAVVLAVGALALQLVAFRLVMVGVVETLKRGVGVIASVLIGRFAFAEPITLAKAVAMVLMATGSAIIAW